jgi:hypothetical protein
LFLLFLILKLTHVIDWSWWWVTSPLWLPVALGLGGLLVLALLGITGYKVVTSLGRRRREQTGRARTESVVEAHGTEVKVSPASEAPVSIPPAVTPSVADPAAPGPAGSADRRPTSS